MEIMRTVDGKKYKFKLTKREIRMAYLEHQHLNDIEDIMDVFNSMSDDELMENYGKTYRELKKLAPDMATQMRKYINRDDVSWQSARDGAIAEYACGGK